MKAYFCYRHIFEPRPEWLEKISIVAIHGPRPDCNIRNFFHRIADCTIVFRLLLFPNNRFFISRCCVLCILNLSEKRESMDEQTCRDFLEGYFEGKFDLLSFIKRDPRSCDINFNCNISHEEGVNFFVDFYMNETNKTIKLKLIKERG